MEHGYLDWNTIEVNEGWYNEVLEAFALDFNAVTDLRKLILGNQRALTRIVQQHSDLFLVRITKYLRRGIKAISLVGSMSYLRSCPFCIVKLIIG